jgi:alpha-N-arabinofuranosidase
VELAQMNSILLLLYATDLIMNSQQPVTLTVNVDRPGPKIDPIFYGLMNEEINFSYDGGLYAELIRNRSFRDNPQTAVNWSVAKYNGGDGSIALDKDPVPNTALNVALKLDAGSISGTQRVGAANEGYWGIPVKTGHHISLCSTPEASANFKGPLNVRSKAMMGKPFSQRPMSAQTGPVWKKCSDLKTGKVPSSQTVSSYRLALPEPSGLSVAVSSDV